MVMQMSFHDAFLMSNYCMAFISVLYSDIQQDCIPVGCVPRACCPYLPACTASGGSALGGSPGGVCSVGGVCYQGGTCLWSGGGYLPLVPGVYLPLFPGRGVYPSMQWGRTPPVNRSTDMCKNITFTNFVCGQ